MKKVIFLLSMVFVLVSLIGCSDDGDGGNSSPTGIDFSSDDALVNLDSYLAILGTDSDFRIMIASKNNVTSSELTINGNGININSNWTDISLFNEDFTYGVFIDDSMLPETLIIQPGAELDITFKLNGTTYNQEMTVPQVPNVQTQDLDLEKDFTVTWSLSEDPDVQVVNFEGESYFWDDEDEGFDVYTQVDGDSRSHTFAKSNYSQYVLPGLSWYQYGVETINYKSFSKTIIVLSSDNYIEGFGFDEKDSADKILKTNNLIKSIIE